MRPVSDSSPSVALDRRRRSLVRHAAAGVGAFAAAGGGWLPAGSARALVPDLSQLRVRGVLRVAMAAFDSAPFFSGPGLPPEGWDVEIAQGLARSLRLELEWVRAPTTFNAVVAVTGAGAADLGISKISRTLERAERVRFSKPYQSFAHALLVHRESYARLTGGARPEAVIPRYSGSLGVLAQSAYERFATHHFPSAAIRTYPDWPTLVAALARAEVTAAYRDEFEVKRVLAARPELALVLRTMTIADRSDTLAVAIRPDAPGLHGYVDLWLETQYRPHDLPQWLRASARRG